MDRVRDLHWWKRAAGLGPLWRRVRRLVRFCTLILQSYIHAARAMPDERRLALQRQLARNLERLIDGCDRKHSDWHPDAPIPPPDHWSYSAERRSDAQRQRRARTGAATPYSDRPKSERPAPGQRRRSVPTPVRTQPRNLRATTPVKIVPSYGRGLRVRSR